MQHLLSRLGEDVGRKCCATGVDAYLCACLELDLGKGLPKRRPTQQGWLLIERLPINSAKPSVSSGVWILQFHNAPGSSRPPPD